MSHRSPVVATTWLCAALCVCMAAVGCSRGRYYLQADREVSTLLAEKSCDPRWNLPANFTVRMDPRSRYYDEYSQIFPPMPPDDPTSHRYMHCVDGKLGWPRWHANGDRTDLENGSWRDRIGEFAEITPGGAIRLDLPTAVRLAYLNSLDWQDQLETLYLSALDVSTERFRFDVQLFGGNDTVYANRGPLNNAGPSTTWSTISDLRIRKYFASAGTLGVGLINSVMWQFAGPDKYNNVSLVNFNLVQPLLQRAGRSIALEPLTIVERALLANLRTLQFYRQGFFLQVAFGGAAPQQLQRRGGFFGGTGFTGFTGTGIGGFGNLGGVFFGGNGVGLQVGGGGTGGAGFAGGGAGNVGGFFGLLQLRQQIRNAEQNLAAQQRALALLDANLEGGLVGLDQVDQLRQSVETNRAGLLQAKTTLTNTLEAFKVNVLCIPSDTPIALDEGFIKPFQFISPDLQSLQNDLGDFLAENSVGAEEDLKETEDPRIDDDQSAERLPAPANESGRTNAASDERDAAGADAAGAAATDGGPVRADAATEAAEDEAALALVERSLERLAELRKRVAAQAAEVEEDLERTGSASEARLAGMRPTERDTFNREMRLLKDDLAKLLVRTREHEVEMEKLAASMTKATLRQTADRFVKLVTDISSAVDEMSLIQARARVEAITIDFDPIDPDEAFEIARANRLDWMNNRAALVDQWRLIQFNAMALLSGLDVVVDGGINTVGNNPAKFRAPTGAISAGLQFDAPFTRLTERNNFRQAILDYQQVRRQQIQYEDRIKLAIRQSLRQLDLDRQNLETQRRAVIIAIRRVDQTRLNLAQPAPPPPMPGPDGTSPPVDPTAGQLGPTATLNLIFAFNDLRSSQDALTSIWINYYATRASLAQQLGVMQLTDDGLWIESSLDCVERAADDEMPLPPPVPREWLDHLEEVKAPPPRPAAADGKNPAPGNAPAAPLQLPGPANDGEGAGAADAPLLVPAGAPSTQATPATPAAGGWTAFLPRIPGFNAPSPAGK